MLGAGMRWRFRTVLVLAIALFTGCFHSLDGSKVVADSAVADSGVADGLHDSGTGKD